MHGKSNEKYPVKRLSQHWSVRFILQKMYITISWQVCVNSRSHKSVWLVRASDWSSLSGDISEIKKQYLNLMWTTKQDSRVICFGKMVLFMNVDYRIDSSLRLRNVAGKRMMAVFGNNCIRRILHARDCVHTVELVCRHCSCKQGSVGLVMLRRWNDQGLLPTLPRTWMPTEDVGKNDQGRPGTFR